MKKVLLVVLPYLVDVKKEEKTIKLRSFESFPYGVLSIASFIKDKAEVKVYDCNFKIQDSSDNLKDHFNYVIKSFQPDIVGFSMMFDNCYSYLGELLLISKASNRNIITLLGGAATVFVQEEILSSQPNLDAICYGEGELPFKELTQATDLKAHIEKEQEWITSKKLLQGISFCKKNIENLDEVIDIDYKFVNTYDYQNKMEEAFSPYMSKAKCKSQFFIVTSRGCKFSCSFCMNSSNLDKTIRYASVDIIINHIRKLIYDYRMNVLTIYDDQILSNVERAKELFQRLAEFNLRIEMPNGISVMYLDEELVDLMWKAGVDTVYLAIESGSPEIIKKMNKPVNLSKVKEKVQLLRKYNFFILGYFVTGMPDETEEHRQETINFIKDVGFDWVSFSLASPVRGSKLYSECIERGYIKKEEMQFGNFKMPKYIINNGSYSPEYITKKNYLMNLDVNFVNNYRLKIGDYKMARWCFEYVSKKYPNHILAKHMLNKIDLKENLNWREYFDLLGLV